MWSDVDQCGSMWVKLMSGGFEGDQTLGKVNWNDIKGVWMVGDDDERRWTIDDGYKIRFRRDQGSMRLLAELRTNMRGLDSRGELSNQTMKM